MSQATLTEVSAFFSLFLWSNKRTPAKGANIIVM